MCHVTGEISGTFAVFDGTLLFFFGQLFNFFDGILRVPTTYYSPSL